MKVNLSRDPKWVDRYGPREVTLYWYWLFAVFDLDTGDELFGVCCADDEAGTYVVNVTEPGTYILRDGVKVPCFVTKDGIPVTEERRGNIKIVPRGSRVKALKHKQPTVVTAH